MKAVSRDEDGKDEWVSGWKTSKCVKWGSPPALGITTLSSHSHRQKRRGKSSGAQVNGPESPDQISHHPLESQNVCGVLCIDGGVPGLEGWRCPFGHLFSACES